MTRDPDSLRGSPVDAMDRHPGLAALAATVAAVKGPVALAPVTIVTPSAYAALAARRALGAAAGPEGRRGIANVTCTTVHTVVRQLGVPGLAARGLRLAPGPVDLEAIRTRAVAGHGGLAELVAHPRGLLSLRDAVAELRRCPAPTLAALGGRHGGGGELARHVDAVRTHLHERGFADTVDLAQAALVATG